MNWETIPTFICIWMTILIAVQYFKKIHPSTYLMSVSYFLILFISGFLTHITEIAPLEVTNSVISSALRCFASGLLLTLVCWHSGNTNELTPSGKKRSVLIKLPIFMALVTVSLYQLPRVYSLIELLFAIIIFFVLRNNKERQGVRIRLFVKSSILGFLFLVFKIGFSSITIFQVLALLAKLAAFYYLYCLVSSYAAQSYLYRQKNVSK